MENTIEFEICKKTVNPAKRSYIIPIVASLSWIVIAFMINFFIGGCSVVEMFEGGLYWIGFGNMILGLVLAVIFIILHFLPTTKIELVLTNKRIYISQTKDVYWFLFFFKRTIKSVESHNLDKFICYEFTKISRKKRSISTLSFKTPATQRAFVVDEEFYDSFVAAVNSAC